MLKWLSGLKNESAKNKEKFIEHYISSGPDHQNALDIFKGEWTSKLPGEFGNLKAGEMPLFEDQRILWSLSLVGDLNGKTVLELGPLEAAHSYILSKCGAKSILAIEANSRAFLKCLIIKEIVGLEKVKFFCGDFMEFLRKNNKKFDFCLASGVLYHMANPVELIDLISKTTDRVYFWTQYYDKNLMAKTPRILEQVSRQETVNYNGFKHDLYYIEYPEKALQWKGFCGGPKPFRCLMTRKDILSVLQMYGFKEVKIGFDEPNHEFGPAFALTAFK